MFGSPVFAYGIDLHIEIKYGGIMEILSYVLSLLSLASMITASLIKGEKMKKTLFFVFCGNVLVATSYLVGGSGFNGAVSCYIGGVQAIINYLFASKNKPLPKWIIVIYALTFVACNLAVGDFSPLVFIAVGATLCFVMSIAQPSGAKYRFWTLINICLWCAYDVLSKSYGALITHIVLLVFNLAGMIIHDRKKKQI